MLCYFVVMAGTPAPIRVIIYIILQKETYYHSDIVFYHLFLLLFRLCELYDIVVH